MQDEADFRRKRRIVLIAGATVLLDARLADTRNGRPA